MKYSFRTVVDKTKADLLTNSLREFLKNQDSSISIMAMTNLLTLNFRLSKMSKQEFIGLMSMAWDMHGDIE